ncbi:hypothetical protein K7I13_05745 [Brucepastera parasyntrophica]|uniref:hypothetical protein n=1 Tax=Brucepastera parasyntrophica TaxID=2880008 RepID=UPI00210A2CA4|nr:hypothetical protein [Brucepastera parasyntrophica]ULQ60770.1 hypothetical protein K7I13_05745 [Brucepastera parasyntrophica]
MACATGTRMLRYRALNGKERPGMKGHHAGLLEQEMIVPLIVACNEGRAASGK